MPLALDLASLSVAYQRGALTPLDVIDEVFARLARTPHHGVFIHEQAHEQARSAARAVMARRASGEPLRLFGIPFAVKDNIDVAGLPTTAACPAFGYLAERSAASVERLLAEGAILIGKTNLDQFATGLVGVRSPYGIPENPFDASYVPGGSSSGSAVAVARGFCTFALATDTAGSGRVPAGFNGLCGLKPSAGVLSTRGVVPACRSLDCVSVLARFVRDAAEVAHVLAGFDPEDPYSRPEAARWDPRPGLAPPAFRFGVPEASQLVMAEPYSPALFASAVERARQLGGTPRAIDLQPFARTASLLYDGPWVAERLEAAGDLLARSPEALHPVIHEILARATSYTALDAYRGMQTLHSLRTAIAPLWDDIDFLLVPTAPTLPRVQDVLADPFGVNAQLGAYTNFVNLLDLCALAVPAGFTKQGLPFGVTLIARRGRDAMLAAVGDRLHHASLAGSERPAEAQPESPPAPLRSAGGVLLAVVGAHLAGEPLNHQLSDRGARLIRATQTAARYRLFALPTTPAKPGLVRVGESETGYAVEVEVWELSSEALGAFMLGVGAPLCIGSVELADGARVLGFLCENAATLGQPDISRFGGWRAFRSAASAAGTR